QIADGATLALNGNVTVNSLNTGTTTLAASSTISGGSLALLAPNSTAGATRTFTVNDSPVINDMVITSSIVDGAAVAGALAKAGSGRLVLAPTTSNTFTGVTTVSAGELSAQAATALGSTVGGTTVSSGGALILSGGVTIVGETLSLNGTGIS